MPVVQQLSLGQGIPWSDFEVPPYTTCPASTAKIALGILSRLGSARAIACWRSRPAIANLSGRKDCFGEAPKPAREARVIPLFHLQPLAGQLELLHEHVFAFAVQQAPSHPHWPGAKQLP